MSVFSRYISGGVWLSVLFISITSFFQRFSNLYYQGLGPIPWQWCVCISCLVMFRLFVTTWTIAHQTPLFMEFSRQETGVGCHFLLQGIFLTQGLNLGLLCCRQIHYCLNHQDSTMTMVVSLDLRILVLTQVWIYSLGVPQGHHRCFSL